MLKYIPRSLTPTPFDCPDDLAPALHRLLVARGIGSAEAAERFLHPNEGDLLDPFLLSDMDAATALIRAAIREGLPICVYGDYDVDGVCASAILSTWLRDQGARAEVYLPSRHTEGYGLNADAIRAIAGWAKLLVTVDCGVTSVELVALAKQLGLQVVVTDHHRSADQLPDCPVVNPLLNDYPFPHLCGAGVAWKVVWALAGAPPMELIDVAALATVADVVSLTGENRVIVSLGLRRINRNPRLGIAALIEAAGLTGKPVTSTAVAFQLAPRLNAGGRLDTAMRPLKLITTRDPEEARALAEELDAENARRRQIELQILNEAEAQLRDFDFIRHRVLILAGKDWNPGVIGLAASRLVEKYHYPVVMLADQGDKLTGSCRSIEGVDIHAALTGCADTLIRFGGHKQAAGLTLTPERLRDFIDAMDAWLRDNVPPSVYIPTLPYDTELDFESVTPGLIAALEGLQPTGFGNPAPVFRAAARVVEARAVGAEGAHLKLTLAQGGHRIGGIAFREGRRAEALSRGENPVDALFVPKLNEYMGRVSAQLEVRALADADAGGRIASIIDDELTLQCEFLTEILYNRKIDLSEGAAPTPIALDALTARLTSSPQGALVVTGDLSAATRILKAVPQELAPDVLIGTLPEDPRAFNALCVCPAGGDIPRGYDHVTLCAAPAEWLVKGTPCHRLEADAPWTAALPDIDAMRAAFRALQELSRRPLRFHTRTQLAHLAALSSGLELMTALTAIAAIEAMGLFRVDLDALPPTLTRLPVKKADPDACPVWQVLQRWRQGRLDP